MPIGGECVGPYSRSVLEAAGLVDRLGRVRVVAAIAVMCLLASTLGLVGAPAATAQANAIVIAEIFYNPDGQVEDHEFVKLANVSGSAVDVSGWKFDLGVAYTFPAGTSIPSGGYYTIARDLVAFSAVFGGSSADGQFVGVLSNSGETIQLVDAANVIQDVVPYDDIAPWPTSPDGSGDSLQLFDLNLDNALASSWVAGPPAPGGVNDPTLTVLFDLERGFYSGNQQVTLAATVPGATIKYSTSSLGLSQTYTGPITVQDNGSIQVIRAQAFIGGAGGPVAVHSYVFLPDTGVPVMTFWKAHLLPAPGDNRAGIVEFITPPSVPLPTTAEYAGTNISSNGASVGQSDKFFFRDVYGAGTWNADLFSDNYYGPGPIPGEIDQLFLRDKHRDDTHLKQIVTQDAGLEMGMLQPHGRFVRFFDEGVDEDARHLQERPEAGFTATYNGGIKADWQAYTANTVPAGAVGADPSNLAAFSQQVDVPQLIDMMLLQWYVKNSDFYDTKNWRTSGPLTGQGDGADYTWQFFNWDMDYAFGDRDLGGPTQGEEYLSPLNYWDGLVLHAETRNLMEDRIQCHIVDEGGALTAPELLPRIDARRLEYIAAGGVENAAWWPMMQTWPDLRIAWLVPDMIANGLYPAGLDAVSFTLSNGMLSIANPNAAHGQVFFMLDGSDPRLADGSLNPAAQLYGGPVVLPAGRTDVIARSFDAAAGVFGPACNEPKAFDVAVAAGQLPLVINEIHYNPAADGSGADPQLREFIEIYNPGIAAYSLSGLSFGSGVNYTFPSGISLAPGDYWVIADDAAAFTALYGFAPDGTFGDNLSNGGETLTLVAGDGSTIDQVTFGDTAPWPTSPDGTGPSLSLIDSVLDNALAASWQGSSAPGGTPGGSNSGLLAGDVDCDDLITVNDASYALQLVVLLRDGVGSCPLPNPGSDANNIAADISLDGNVDVFDVSVILKCVAGIADPLCP